MNLYLRSGTFPIILLLTFLSLALNKVEAKYSLDDIMDARYRAAVEKGCPDIKVKNPMLAAVLAFLPGGGSFYTGRVAGGFKNLFLYPFSILWDAPASADRSIKQNKLVTVELCGQELERTLPASPKDKSMDKLVDKSVDKSKKLTDELVKDLDIEALESEATKKLEDFLLEEEI